MKRKRVVFPGEIEIVSGTKSPILRIAIEQSCLETWLAIFWALELGLGEITIVPTAGVKCRLVAIEPEARIDTSGEVIRIAFDRRGLRGTSAFLARCFYDEYPVVNHVDLPFGIDSNKDGEVIFIVRWPSTGC